LGVCGAPAAAAVPPDAPVRDRYDLSVRSETYVELFRRALLPGPNGALVATDTAVPVHQYMRVRARDVDTGWRADSLDLEVAAWGRSWIGEGDTERTLDADLQVANVGYQHAPFSLRAGRQHAAGGAARYVRFDGLMLRADLGAGFDAEGYGGFTVLPRWDARPGYHHLGSASDSLLREPEALPEPERSGHWLSGGRLGWQSSRAHAGLSFHEQHDDGLSRRTLGVDGRISIVSEASAGAQALFELDALRAQDARLWVDASPLETLDASLEYRHTEPALFLSRQSVLSVFSTDAYDEAGGAAVTRVTDRFSVESAGFVQFYDADRRGARGELAARVLPGAGKRTLVRIEYTRVVVVDNGYHSLRGSLARRIAHDVSGTLEAYAYLYDEAIRGRVTSEVYAGTLSYQVAPDVNVLWGASLAQSPYASFDLQSLVRLEVDLDLSSPRPVP
jgi:hypothetical protein